MNTLLLALTKVSVENMNMKERTDAFVIATTEWALATIPYILVVLLAILFMLIIAAGKNNMKKGAKKIKFFEIGKLAKAYGFRL